MLAVLSCRAKANEARAAALARHVRVGAECASAARNAACVRAAMIRLAPAVALVLVVLVAVVAVVVGVAPPTVVDAPVPEGERASDSAADLLARAGASGARELAPEATVPRAGGVVEGRVLDRIGAPLAHVEVNLVREGSLEFSTARTAVDGSFRFAHLEPGEARIGALHVGDEFIDFLAAKLDWTPIRVEIDRTTRVELVAPVEGAVLVHGRVRADGPIEGARVTFRALDAPRDSRTRDPSAITDDEGRYAVAIVARGEHSVSAATPGHGDTWRDIEVTDDPQQTCDFEFGTAEITGRVVDADGVPVANVSVTAVASEADAGSANSASARSGPDGAYALLGLRPAAYALRTWFDPSMRPELARAANVRTEEIVVGRGRRHDGVEVRLARGCSVRVRVVGSDGRPARHALVRPENALRFDLPTSTDADGVVVLRNCTAGDVTIAASRGSEVERERVVVAAREDREVEALVHLVPGGRLSLRIVNADGSAADPVAHDAEIVDAHGGRRRAGRTEVDDHGVAEFGAVPVGPCTLRARFGADVVESRIEVAPGVERTVELRAPRTPARARIEHDASTDV